MSVYSASMSEAELQDSLAAELQLRGWRIAHFRAGRTQRGRWSTPLQYNGAGFPDIIGVHPTGGVLAVECKSTRGRLSTAQGDWISAFRDAGATALVAYPMSLHEVSETIRSLTTGARQLAMSS